MSQDSAAITTIVDLSSKNNERWIYISRPEGRVSNSNYELESSPIELELSQNEGRCVVCLSPLMSSLCTKHRRI